MARGLLVAHDQLARHASPSACCYAGAMQCPDCERLNREEAEAAMALAAADRALPANAPTYEREAQWAGKFAAEARLKNARDRLASHRARHHPPGEAGSARRAFLKALFPRGKGSPRRP